jgi:hypothetical protein
MSDTPGTAPGAGRQDEVNAFITIAQRPRLMLLMLAAWSILSVMAETFTSSGLFLENHLEVDGGNLELELDGALGGFALGWQGVPLAALYIYCFRDPPRYRAVFVLALIHMGALAASTLYHWLVTEDFTFESIVVPLAGSLALGALCFLHLFQPREEPVVARRED